MSANNFVCVDHPYAEDHFTKLLALALRLGFTDDVEHWENHISKLKQGVNND